MYIRVLIFFLPLLSESYRTNVELLRIKTYKYENLQIKQRKS